MTRSSAVQQFYMAPHGPLGDGNIAADPADRFDLEALLASSQGGEEDLGDEEDLPSEATVEDHLKRLAS